MVLKIDTINHTLGGNRGVIVKEEGIIFLGTITVDIETDGGHESETGGHYVQIYFDNQDPHCSYMNCYACKEEFDEYKTELGRVGINLNKEQTKALGEFLILAAAKI